MFRRYDGGGVRRTYCHLVSGGQTTVAQLFVNLANGQRGLVALWDAVAFDEAAGIKFQDKNGINIMKNYMEDGTFSRGRDVINAEGSIVFVGNLDGDVQTLQRTSHLFAPMPKEMDTAFFDRIHLYLPGWELGKTRDELYTSHFGFVSDYLAEVLRGLRRTSYMDLPERYFAFGPHVGGRDAKAVRKTVSGAGHWPGWPATVSPSADREKTPQRSRTTGRRYSGDKAAGRALTGGCSRGRSRAGLTLCASKGGHAMLNH
jgi:uncharacterized protein (TIGR02688 family)